MARARNPGRKPKPSALHRLHGTVRPHRHANRAQEPQADGTLLEAPDFLTETQRESWDYALAHAPANILRCIDRTVLVMWVEAEDRHRKAMVMQTELDRNAPLPLLSRGARDGAPIPSPYLRIINAAADIMLRCVAELGFSPASRPRLVSKVAGGVPAEPDSAWAKLRLLQGGKSA